MPGLPGSMRAAAVAASLLIAAGCSMTTEWWIRESLRRAGYDRAEAECAARGLSGHLGDAQLWSVRTAFVSGARPNRFADATELLEWLRPRLEPEVHRALVHYAGGCRRRS